MDEGLVQFLGNCEDGTPKPARRKHEPTHAAASQIKSVIAGPELTAGVSAERRPSWCHGCLAIVHCLRLVRFSSCSGM